MARFWLVYLVRLDFIVEMAYHFAEILESRNLNGIHVVQPSKFSVFVRESRILVRVAELRKPIDDHFVVSSDSVLQHFLLITMND